MSRAKGTITFSVEEIRKGCDQSFIDFLTKLDGSLDKGQILYIKSKNKKDSVTIKWSIRKKSKREFKGFRKKYEVCWYIGSCEGDKVTQILDIKYYKARDIYSVPWQKILPKKLIKGNWIDVEYYKTILLEEGICHVIDYGDAARFIRIKEEDE